MTTKNKLGIFMDHSSAHLMEYSVEAKESQTIESSFTHEAKVKSLGKSEHTMHNKEQHLQNEFYKKLGEIIRNYDEIILFGPTDAKKELFNHLKADHLFAEKKINVKQTDKMTDNQQHAYVRQHFS
jgi:stalled ribosome rescue protein Dom34